MFFSFSAASLHTSITILLTATSLPSSKMPTKTDVPKDPLPRKKRLSSAKFFNGGPTYSRSNKRLFSDVTDGTVYLTLVGKRRNTILLISCSYTNSRKKCNRELHDAQPSGYSVEFVPVEGKPTIFCHKQCHSDVSLLEGRYVAE